MNPHKTGLLLCNLGTPKSTSTKDVRKYLRQFLMDPYVIDILWPLRWLLVYCIILIFRPKKAAEAYKKIWTTKGSPLLQISLEQKENVLLELKAQNIDWSVEVGMRYGEPSLRSALEKFKAEGVTQIIFLPLYPQYALSSTKTAQVELLKQISDLNYDVEIKDASEAPFHSHVGFVRSWVDIIQRAVDLNKMDHLLFSFHGLPERHIQKTESEPGYCFKPGCCDRVSPKNHFCYRAHCYATAREIAKTLNLQNSQYSVAFQSRLGRTPWIQPYTDQVIPLLAQNKNIKSLAVACPSFVTDCLETLEEIGIRGRELFLTSKEKQFTAVPCLNSDPLWIKAIVDLAQKIYRL